MQCAQPRRRAGGDARREAHEKLVDQEACVLAAALSGCCSLARLGLPGARLDHKRARTLVDAIAQCAALTEVDLTGAELRQSEVKALRRCMAERPALSVVPAAVFRRGTRV